MNLFERKQEVYSPKISDFALSANNEYSIESIKAWEQEICKVIPFLWPINPQN